MCDYYLKYDISAHECVSAKKMVANAGIEHWKSFIESELGFMLGFHLALVN